jgi:hypothetical protein
MRLHHLRMGITPTTVANRASGPTQFDFATVAGSVYNDNTGAAVVGMVAQFSYFDAGNDPQNNRGLYAIVATDQYGLASKWTGFSGLIVGHDAGSNAAFTNSSVLTKTLAGSCVGGSSPVSGIPWPGSCSGPSTLLPATTLTTVNSTGETSNLCKVGASTALVAANQNLVFTSNLSSDTCSCISNANRIFIKSTDEDTGARPINFGTQPFWESPDLFLVPTGTTVVDDSVSSETLLTPGNVYDVYVRVNNDFGCNPSRGPRRSSTSPTRPRCPRRGSGSPSRWAAPIRCTWAG